MDKNKTKATDASVGDYIASRAKAQQGDDCQALMALLEKVTGQVGTMWGPSIVGYGSYRYTYDTGRTGEAPLTGFAIRGRELVLYLSVDSAQQQALLVRLGKHKMGKSCLYFKQLADLDRSVLEELLLGSVTEIKGRHA
jgi:nucleoid DNA-binding protein